MAEWATDHPLFGESPPSEDATSSEDSDSGSEEDEEDDDGSDSEESSASDEAVPLQEPTDDVVDNESIILGSTSGSESADSVRVSTPGGRLGRGQPSDFFFVDPEVSRGNSRASVNPQDSTCSTLVQSDVFISADPLSPGKSYLLLFRVRFVSKCLFSFFLHFFTTKAAALPFFL